MDGPWKIKEVTQYNEEKNANHLPYNQLAMLNNIDETFI